MPTESIRRLQDAAAEVVSRVRYCWLVTRSRDGAGSARPMGRILPDRDGASWTVRFITDRRSHKASAIEHAPDVELIFQDEVREAFVALDGRARLLTDPIRVRELWNPGYNRYFPTESDRANAIFVEVRIQRMRLWIRGVTPEPFGLRPVVLRRDAHDDWQEP